MLDTTALTRMVEDQIKTSVNAQVLEVLTSEEWLVPLEQKIIKYTQDRILGKFANADAVPEILEAVKHSVSDLFAQGKIPGITQFIDQDNIKQSIDLAVEQLIETSIGQLASDPEWLEKIERMINQTVIQRTVARIGSLDVPDIIRRRVDENMEGLHKTLLKDFSSTGIKDTASQRQLTVMDENVVIENCLTTKDLEVVGSTVVKDLTVKGSINTDNQSWNTLADAISQKTLVQLNDKWRTELISQVTKQIQDIGIAFEQVTIGDEPLLSGGRLANKITDSNLQSLGRLRDLKVTGEAHIYNTVSVVNKRLGVNTEQPEMALSVWDEEVSVIIGKHKAKQAYIGTSRDSGIAIGVNRMPHIEIDVEGLTTVKKLRVGQHRISHNNIVPGWSGTRGDVVFNSNPGPDQVFAWMCLGGLQWRVLKSVE
jgi:hypothetical protein